MTTVNNDPMVMVRDDVFTQEFCDHCITKFENDTQHHQGTTSGGTDLLVKKSKDLAISILPHWSQEDKSFSEIVTWSIEEYTKHLANRVVLLDRRKNEPIEINPVSSNGGGTVTDQGYQMQKTLPGDGYTWHTDFEVCKANGIRHLTFIFYLNTVDEGWTQFYNGDQVAPERGRVVIFPATWNYVHQGYPPKQNKYIVTGWIFESIDNIL